MIENKQEFALLQAVNILGLFDQIGQAATIAILHHQEF